jgi:hypothetical protein
MLSLCGVPSGKAALWYVLSFICDFVSFPLLLMPTDIVAITYPYNMSNDSSASTVLGYRLVEQGSRIPFMAGAGNFSLRHHVQNGWGHEADHSLPSSAKVKEWVGLYLHSPNTHLWHGVQFKKSTGTTLPYLYLNLTT